MSFHKLKNSNSFNLHFSLVLKTITKFSYFKSATSWTQAFSHYHSDYFPITNYTDSATTTVSQVTLNSKTYSSNAESKYSSCENQSPITYCENDFKFSEYVSTWITSQYTSSPTISSDSPVWPHAQSFTYSE